MAARAPQDDEYPPLPLRRRALVLLLAVATAATILLMLIYRPGDPKREAPRAPRQQPATVLPDAASGVGGKADILLLPSSPAPSPPR